MLTSDLAIIRFRGDRAEPDRLTRARHGHYVELAHRMLDVYRDGVGRPRTELHRAVEALFLDEPDCDARRVHAFCKLLDDVSVFRTDGRAAARLRLEVFGRAARFQPVTTQPAGLVGTPRQQVVETIAAELGIPWAQIENDLYSDVIAYQPLLEFAGFPDGAALLSRYNVAQTQAALYRAREAVITSAADFKRILRAVKLARLMHQVHRLDAQRYRIRLTGPASVLRSTTRYGIHLARLLPALLACRGWDLVAPMDTPWGTRASLHVGDADGLTSHLPETEEFDSTLEEKFAARFGQEREGWTLHREAVILHHGQVTFVPDFLLRHEDGTEVLLEIVGFWTPEYLESKRETLRTFKGKRVLLAVPEVSLREGVTLERLADRDVVVFKTALKPASVLEKAEAMRTR